MAEMQLRTSIALGQGDANRALNSATSDTKRLATRAPKGTKRTPDEDAARESDAGRVRSKYFKPSHPSHSGATINRKQSDIRTAMTAAQAPNPGRNHPPPPLPISLPTPSSDPTTTLPLTPTLSSFRRRVLLALLQVPRGRYTTYAALSSFLGSSPRAVGNALRNNPFAPAVPCHRVVAADGGIGGFGGEWGAEGRFAAEKVRLLRGEGVRFDGRGRVVGGVWAGFV